MKKILCLLLAVCMLMPLAVSCGEKNPPAVTTAPNADPGTPTGPVETTVPVTTVYPDIPTDVKYDDYEFVILSCLANTIVFNDFSNENTDYDVVNDAIFKRNAEAESLLGIIITSTEVSGNVFSEGIGVTTLRQDFTAGESNYDLCGLSTWHAATCALNGFLTDFEELSYIDLEQPWWDQRITTDLGIGNRMFYSNGDIGITDNLATHCILFSKTLAAEKNITDIYDLVLEGKWTWDKFEEYVRMVSEDLDGDDVMTPNDRFGLLCWNDAFQASFGASRCKIASPNPDTGALELTMYNDKTVSLANRITTLCYDIRYSNNCAATAYSGAVNELGGMIGMFGNGQGLFVTNLFRNVPKLRDVEMDFGIIPYPKYDENQKEYGGYVSATYSNMYGVQFHNQDLERTGIVTELLACLSMQYVTPAYYEQTLKGREARDEESIQCLEIIFANRSFDAGVFYGIGGYTGSLTDMMKNLSTKFENIYNTNKRGAENKIKTINKKLRGE